MNRMPVVLFSNRAKAEPILKRLAQAGIEADIFGEPTLARLWFVPRRCAGVRVEVPAEQFDRAEQLLHKWNEREAALGEAIRCPECGSLRVEYPQFTRKSLLTNLALGAAAELGLVEKDYYCKDCHYTWPKEGTRPRRAQPHMAPYYFIEGVEQTARQPKKPFISPSEESGQKAA